MNKKVTEVVFILDRSGSMAGLESDTIGGYNAMIEKQKEVEGEVVMTTVLFDDGFELLHDRIPLHSIKPMTKKEYFVRGTTALLDAIGKAIQKIVNVQRNTIEGQQSEKVLFVITTDGQENASIEYGYEQIKMMIEKQKKEFNWEFIFLGANIDATLEARKFGIGEERVAQYHNDTVGIELNYQAVSKVIMEMRAEESISENWKESIEENYKNRAL